MANDSGPRELASPSRGAPSEEDTQARLERAVRAIRKVLLAPQEKDAATGQIRAWMADEKD
jgi:hypothetical protein